jgi:hypothetical protein
MRTLPPPLATRDVHLEPDRTYNFGDYQLNYLDYRTRRLIPSTRIFQEDELFYRTNSLGCVGEELEPGAPVVALFGDSCTHGYKGRSFAEQVRLSGCQPLNAGVEGLTLPAIVDRFQELRDRVPMVAAAVHSGWHNILYNDRTEAFWAAQFDRISGPPVIAHYRLVGDINADAVREGYQAVFSGAADYQRWGGVDYDDPADRSRAFDEIERFNVFIEAYCRERGRVLIDVGPATAPARLADLGRNFLDFVHPSPLAYPAIARAIEGALAGPVARALPNCGQTDREQL